MLLGAYVLDSLEQVERDAVDQHLARCGQCSTELGGLTPLRDILAAIDPDDLDLVDSVETHPSPDLFDRVSAEIKGAGTSPAGAVPPPAPPRQWWGKRRALAVAAAAVILASAGIGIGTLGATGGSAQHRYTATAGAVHLSVELDSGRSGTTVHLTVSGVPSNEHCTLVAVARNGARHGAGQWVATYTGTAQFTGSTDITRSHLRRIFLLGAGGRTLVSVAV